MEPGNPPFPASLGNEAAAHAGLGYALIQLGRFEDAAAAYREALRIDPGNAVTNKDLGYALIELGRFEDAAAAYREALRIDPGNAAATMASVTR